ncbi:NUC173-domain-containing protein [Lichtheimia hyalospora FSU 10163]|nr:NUC173-domain-containing protein [Lichtheimia hyalospora FSU 10163]
MEAKFDKIRSQANSKLENLKLYARTLLAIEEMTTLQATSADSDIAGALVYLLNDVLGSLPQAVVRSKFNDIMHVLEVVYEHHKDEQPVLRSVVGCLQELLVKQDANAWSMPVTKKAFQMLLLLSVNTSVKARKAAHDAIRVILSSPPPPTAQHPAANATADFVLRILHETNKNDQHAAQQILSLLQSIVAYWPANRFTVLCQTLLQLPKFNNVFLTKSAFEVFEALFDVQETDIEEEKFIALLNAIGDIKPSAIDERLLPAWLMIISKAYPAYSKMNPEQCAIAFPAVFATIFNDFQQESRVFRQMADCLSALIEYCVTPNMITQATQGQQNGLTNMISLVESGLGVHYQAAWTHVMTVQQALFRKLHRASAPLMDGCVVLLGELRLASADSYKESLDKTLGAAITHMGAEHFLGLLPLNLEGADANNVGRAFLLPLLKTYVTNTHLGYFVNVLIPLGDRLASKGQQAADQGLDLQAKVYETLVNQIWSLAPRFCDLPVDLCSAFTETVAERFSSLLYSQPEQRPNVAQALQSLIEKNQTLAKSSASDKDLQAAYGITQSQANQNIQHMSKFAVNYLAVFFNVYSQIGAGHRGFLNEVIKSFLSIATAEDINSTFKKVLGLLSQALENPSSTPASNDPSIPPPMSYTMLDLSVIMVPFLDPESMQLLYNGTLTSLINKEDEPALQKKGYKILYHLMQTPSGRQIGEQNIGELQERVLEATPSCTIGARKNRVNALRGIVELLPSSDLHFIPAILSEVVISSKDSSEKTRNAAFTLLVEMGNKMRQGGTVKSSKLQGFDETAPDTVANIGEYFTMVTAGLAGTTAHMISATIVALSRIFFEFKDDLSPDLVMELLQTITVFVGSNNREIIASALGYVKVCIVVLPDEMVEPQLEAVVSSLVQCSHQTRNHFKLKLRHIFERLIRRFGYNKIHTLVPEEDKKLIANIQKRRLRAKRRKAADHQEDSDEEMAEEGAREMAKKTGAGFHDAYEEALYGSESELDGGSDDEVLQNVKSALSKVNNKKKGLPQTFIREGADDAPLDFLDRSALSRITSSKPMERKKQTLAKSAEYDDEGRMVFKESDDESDNDSEEEETEDYYMQAQKSADGFVRTQQNKIKFKKGGQNNDFDDNDAMDVDQGAAAKRKKRTKQQFEMIGKEFRSKKAGGDVKKRNQSDPYAYVPLGKVTKKGRKGPKITYTGRLKR